jgi:hypothetical protein
MQQTPIQVGEYSFTILFETNESKNQKSKTNNELIREWIK